MLRMIAGFEEPTSGDIEIRGRNMLGVPPNKRPVNLVFQHLALFPMMNVAENIAFGLRRRKTPKKRDSATGGTDSRAGGPARLWRKADQPAFRRSEAARGHCPLSGARTVGAFAGRTPRRPGPEAARTDEGGAEKTPGQSGHHVHLHHCTISPRLWSCRTMWP